jgi:hypothetical protein
MDIPQELSGWPDIGTSRAQINDMKHMKHRTEKGTQTYAIVATEEGGRPEDSAGQSGDTQGLSDVADADAESVTELLEEGQSFEAEAVSGVENAPDPDVAEVHTRQVPEDDVPLEYLEGD